MRQIDADALTRELKSIKTTFGSGNGLVEGGLEIAISTTNAMPTINQWIPCSGHPPKIDEEVFVYLFGDSPYIAWFDGDDWQTDDFTVDDDEHPTAWMPLPQPWEGAEDD